MHPADTFSAVAVRSRSASIPPQSLDLSRRPVPSQARRPPAQSGSANSNGSLFSHASRAACGSPRKRTTSSSVESGRAASAATLAGKSRGERLDEIWHRDLRTEEDYVLGARQRSTGDDDPGATPTHAAASRLPATLEVVIHEGHADESTTLAPLLHSRQDLVGETQGELCEEAEEAREWRHLPLMRRSERRCTGS